MMEARRETWTRRLIIVKTDEDCIVTVWECGAKYAKIMAI